MMSSSSRQSFAGPMPGASLPPDWALFVDLDAVLVDAALATDRAQISLELSASLGAIAARLAGAAAVFSVRSLYEIDALLVTPVDVVAAECGAIVRAPASLRREFAPDLPEDLMIELAEATQSLAGIELERRAKIVSLRYHKAPHNAQALRIIAERAVKRQAGFELFELPMALHIKSRRASKGAALARLMCEAPFKGRVPVFASAAGADDGGFAAVRRFAGATFRLDRDFAGDPEVLRAWLLRLGDRRA